MQRKEIKQAIQSILNSIDSLDPDGSNNDARALSCTEVILDSLSTYLEIITGRKAITPDGKEGYWSFSDINDANSQLYILIWD